MGGEGQPLDEMILAAARDHEEITSFLLNDHQSEDRVAEDLHLLRVEQIRPHSGAAFDGANRLIANTYIQLDGTTVQGAAKKGFIAFRDGAKDIIRRPSFDRPRGWIRVDLSVGSMPLILDQLSRGGCYLSYAKRGGSSVEAGLFTATFALPRV